MSKGEILEKMVNEMPYEIYEQILPYVKEAMGIYSKQECIELLKFIRKKTDTPVTYYLGLRAKYNKDILDNEDIFNEYQQSKNQK